MSRIAIAIARRACRMALVVHGGACDVDLL